MSATPWTPGPWFVDKGGAGYLTLVCQDTYGDGNRRIAETFIQRRKKMPLKAFQTRVRQNEANARLIQHAPEMVEALEAIAAPDALLDANGGAFGPMAARRMQEIAKAMLVRIRGETP